MKRKLIVALIAAALLITVLAVSLAQQAPKPECQTVMVPMRDGVRLAADVYLPPGVSGPVGAVLTRTPYGKGGFTGDAAAVNRAGYAFVAQDMRGRYASEGEDTLFLTDAGGELQDGYDTIEWIAAQDWCNGNVGTRGGSAMGITQYMALCSAPPHLRCAHVSVAAPSIYHYAGYYGGVFRQAMVTGWLTGHRFRPENLQLVLDNPSYNDMWRIVDLSNYADRVTVPVIHRGGWFDCFGGGTVYAYRLLQEHGGDGARGNQFLIMGPTTHGRSNVEALAFPNEDKPPFTAEADFYHWNLRGADVDTNALPRVYYYVMGAVGEDGAPGNVWRTAADWPPAYNATRLYLGADGTAATTVPAQGALSYEYDPRNPVPTVGGANLLLARGSMDQRRVEERSDVLIFNTPVLAGPVEITGPLSAVLYVSSDCPDTDFTIKLTDVYPDGRSMLIADGIRRARYRNSFETPEFMEPGEVCRVEVDVWNTSIILNAGHRLRVAVSSSNAPRFSANPNTGAPDDRGDQKRVANNTIHLGGEHASHVLLPVVEGDL